MYEYIAQTNPQGAYMLLKSYGYKLRDKRNLGQALRKLVAQEGEPALRQIADLHPDKELIMDVYSNADGCGCSSCSKALGKEMKENFYGVDGSSTSTTKSTDMSSVAMQTNTFLLVATIIIAAAIITNNK